MTHITKRLLAGYLALSCCLAGSACGAPQDDEPLSETRTPVLSAFSDETDEREDVSFTALVSDDGEIRLTWEGDSTLLYEVTRTLHDSGNTSSLGVIHPGDAFLITDSYSDSGIFCTYRLIPYTDASAQANNEPCGDAFETTLQHGFLLEDGYLRYYENNAPAANTEINGLHFDREGFYTCGDKDVDDLIARDIRELTQPQMTATEKYYALYLHVMDYDYFNYAAQPYVSSSETGWEPGKAKEFMTTGLGNCFSYAAMTTLYARALGFEAKSVIGDCHHGFNWAWHCWTEVTIDGEAYICDAEMEGVFAPEHQADWDLFLVTTEEAPVSYAPYIPESTD